MDNQTGIDAKLLRMTTEPVESLVCRMAVPTIVIMLISAMYNMADTYFVGRLGTSATAAVGVSFSLMTAIQAIGFFFGHGAGNFISRQLGARNFDNASRMAVTGFATALAAGAILGGLGLGFVECLALALGSTQTILPHATEYLRFILLAAPWMAASLTLNNLLRFQGSAFYGMIGMASGAILNVFLDPLFIFVLGMGVSGASFATMISQFVSFCLLLYGCTRTGNIVIRFANFSPRLSDYREIIRGGFPSLCRQGVASVAVVVLNRMAGNFGDAAIAAMSIVQRVYWFGNAALIGWGQGFQPVCGINYGAGLLNRVTRAFWFCVKYSSVFLTIAAVAGFVYAPEIIASFRDDDNVIRIGAYALRCQCLMMPFMSWTTLNNMMLQTMGKAVPASLLAFARQGLFLLPILFILTPRYGIWGIQVAQPLADMLTLLLSLPLGLGVLRSLVEEREKTGPAQLGTEAFREVADDM